jgi:hypothetical protein
MKILLATMAAVFIVTLLGAPQMGAGWFWDTGNGIGFAAFAGLLYLTITSNRRLDVRAHQVLGYVVLTLVIGHAFWFLLGRNCGRIHKDRRARLHVAGNRQPFRIYGPDHDCESAGQDAGAQ